MNRRPILALLLVLSQCREPRELALADAAFPNEVDWVALIALDGAGEFISASGLVRRERGASVRLLRENDELPATYLVVGYSHGALEDLIGVATPTDLLRARLAVAGADDPILPAPAYAQRFGAGDGALLSDAGPQPPELTAAWLPRCPIVTATSSAELDLDLGCSLFACGGTIEQEGCTITLDTASCDLGVLRASVGGRGAVRFFESGRFASCDAHEPLAPAVFAATCNGEGACELAAYDSTPESLPLDLKTRALFNVPQEKSGYLRNGPGVLTGLVPLEDTIVVSAHEGYFILWLECAPPGSDRFFFLDPETLETSRTATAPDCLTRIAPDPLPGARGFIGIFGVDERRVGRFDENGRLVDSAPIAHPGLTPDHFVPALESFRDEERIVAVLSADDGPSGRVMVNAFVVSIDARDLTRQQISTELIQPETPQKPNVVNVAAQLPNGRFVVVDNGEPEYLFEFDPRNAMRLSQTSLWDDCTRLRRVSPSAIVEDPASGALVFGSASGDSRGFYVEIPGTTRCATASFYGYLSRTTAMIPWPGDPTKMLAAVFGIAEDDPSSLVFFEPAVPRVLPERTRVGIGAVSEMKLDARGRIWLLIPTHAEVIRATPR